MKKMIGLAFVLGVASLASVAHAESARLELAQAASHRHAPQAAADQRRAAENPPKPYAHSGEGNNDGLSRDADDCNKGCIGGNAN